MAEELNGLEFVGKCYDLLTVDPLNLGGSAKRVNAIDVAREGIATYTQGSYVVPRGVNLQSPFNTEVKTFRSLIRNSFDFQSEFSSTLEANAGVTGLFEFSASDSCKEISSISESRTRVFTYATVYVQNHVVSLEMAQPQELRLGADFAQAVKALPPERRTTAHHKAYAEFVRKFGTHFSERISLGGMAYSRVSSVAAKVTASKEKEQSFKASASLELEAFSAGTSASEARRSVQKSDAENEVERTVLVFRGGIGNTHEIANEWFDGLKARPAPIPTGTELVRSSALLTPDFFPTDPDIDAKRQALDVAVDDYIVASGAQLDGVIRYGDKLALCFPSYDHERRAYLSKDRLLAFHNMSAAAPDGSAPAVLSIVDPAGRWGAPGQQAHEVIMSAETLVNVRVANETGQPTYLAMLPEDRGDQQFRVGLTADPRPSTAQWSLGLVDSRANPGPRTARPLVSGDYVLLSRLDQPSKSFFTIIGRQPMPQSDYPMAVRKSQYDPMFGGVESRANGVMVLRKLKP